VVEHQYGVLRHGLSKLTDPGVEWFWLSGGEGSGTGRRLGIFKPHEVKAKKAREKETDDRFWIEVVGRRVPATNTDEGIRAVQKGKPVDPDSVRRYLEDKFGDDLKAVRSAMQ
jgi:hypothetical protein